MQATEAVKQIISDHLQGLGQADPLFAETLKKPNKSIDGCVAYIFNEVKKLKLNFLADDEVFKMATHYYDEDSIKEVSMPVGVGASHSSLPSPPVLKTKPKVAKKPVVQSEFKSLFD